MGSDRIIFIVAVVMCRAAVLQVLSQTVLVSLTDSSNSTMAVTKLSSNSTTEVSNTTMPGCVDFFPNCLTCTISSDNGITWVCSQCRENYTRHEESCNSSALTVSSKPCCSKTEIGGEETKGPSIALIAGSAGGFIFVVLFIVVIVLFCRHRRRRKRSRAEPPLPPQINRDKVHYEPDGSPYKLDRKGNKVYIDVELGGRPPMPPPLAVPHPPSEPEDSGQVYGNDPEQVRIENIGRQRQHPQLPGQLHLPKPPLPFLQKPSQTGEPPRSPPPVPVKEKPSSAALRPPNPPPKPVTPSQSKFQPPAPLKPNPKPVLPRKTEHTSPASHQGDFQDTYEIPDAEKQQDFGETYDDVAQDNQGFDRQESYDDVSPTSHQHQAESDGEDYEPVPTFNSQSPPVSQFANITQERINREYGDDKLYQNQPVLDSKTKTSYRYRNLAMTKGEKIESEAPYLVKR